MKAVTFICSALSCAFLIVAQGRETVEYKKAAERGLQLFIEKPPGWKATDQRPAIVFFFGGGWVGGSPTQFLKQIETDRFLPSLGWLAGGTGGRVSQRPPHG